MSADDHLSQHQFRITDEGRGYHYNGPQTWASYHALGPGGERVGRLDWAQVGKYNDPGREVHVEHLEVSPEHQGKGVASALMDHLYAEHPAPASVTHSLRTGEGAGWWQHYTATRPHVLDREQPEDY